LGITKIGLLANEVSLEHAQTLVTQAQIPISEARITLAQAKYNETEAELLYILNILIPREAIRYNHKESLLNLQHIIKEYELAHRETQNDLNNENRLNLSNLSKTLILADQANKDLVDKEDVRYMDQVAINEWLKVLAVIEAAKKTAAANITTTLTHTIGKAK
jgi:Fe-S cluster biosynthesis and repair protein YggX